MATTHYADWTKMFGDFKAPSVDINHLIAQYRRDAEVFTGVMQIFNENLQKNFSDVAKLTRSNTEHLLKASKELVNHSTPESAASKQADFAKAYVEYNVNGLREIYETSSKALHEALDVISKRAAEKMKDFSEAANTATHPKKKAA